MGRKMDIHIEAHISIEHTRTWNLSSVALYLTCLQCLAPWVEQLLEILRCQGQHQLVGPDRLPVSTEELDVRQQVGVAPVEPAQQVPHISFPPSPIPHQQGQ